MLDELQMLKESEILDSGSVRDLNSTYLRINLDYISLCENNPNLLFMPSRKTDLLMAEYEQKGDVSRAKKMVVRRIGDIINCIKELK